MDSFLVQIEASTLEQLRSLNAFDLDLKYRAARSPSPGQFVVPGILTRDQIFQVASSGYRVSIISDLSRVAQERLQEVSRTNRFSDIEGIRNFEERTVLGYMTVDEVESALVNLRAMHPTLVTLIQLPFQSWEGRTSRAVRIRAGSRTDRPGVLFTGSMHAREWGGSDICINFIMRLINAYRNNTALNFGSKTYSASQVRSILENIDLYVFPDVNPDGKHYSQTSDVSSSRPQGMWWRKNRNPNNGIPGATPGVDLNRNFDFLWSSGIGTSSSTSSAIYKGRNAFSEPESRNVRHLFDTYTNIRYFVDIHSYGELMLYSWGDDNNQTTDPNQNFRNPAYNGQRGTPGDSIYREFISSLDQNTAVMLARQMNDALVAVRGNSYTVQQAVGLYPTSATSDDYAFSRHLIDTLKNKVYSYTIEFGNEFVPPFSEMQNIINDVGAAMTELCWTVNSDVYLRDNAADTGTVPSGGAFWNSPDIWVRNSDDGGTTHQNTIRGRDNFVYVRVNNRGLAEARNLNVRVYLTNFAGTQFVYPNDWIPRNPSGGGSITTPGTYLIGETAIPTLASGSSQVVRVRWQASLIPPETNWHPCLLVEVSPNDGPPHSGKRVWEQNNLAQKNITIVNARRGETIEFSFRVGSPFTLTQYQLGELVLNKVNAPTNVGIYLDVQDPIVLDSLKPIVPNLPTIPTLPTIPSSNLRPIRPPTPIGWNATLLNPVTIAIPLGRTDRASQDGYLSVQLPVNTQVELCRQASEVLLETRSSLQSSLQPSLQNALQQVSGFSLATLDNRPWLNLSAQTQGKLPLLLKPGETKAVTIKMAVPQDAKLGDTYELDVVQYNEQRQAVGGVTLQVNIVD